MKIKREIVCRYLEDYVSTLDPVDLKNFKVTKSCVLYNFLVKEKPEPSDIEAFCRVLYEDKNETLDQIVNRI